MTANSEAITVDTTVESDTLKDITSDESSTINVLPQPDVDELFKQMKIENNTYTDSGLFQTIDVQPDFRPITYQLVDHCVRIYEHLAQLKIPIITPPSLLAYFLQSIYSYGTTLDIYRVRETTSFFGSAYLQHEVCKQYTNLSHYNVIPPFLKEIL